MRKRTKRGFTLVELLLSVSIIILVAGMIVPMVSAFSSGNIVEQSINEIKSYLLLARQQAVQYGTPVAVYFLPPTQLTPNSRMILVQLRDQLASSNDITNMGNWRVIPGEYGAAVRQGIEIRKRGDSGTPAAAFCIVYTSGGFIDSRCPAANTSIRIGPKLNSESRMKAEAVAVNRSTGSIIQLERAP